MPTRADGAYISKPDPRNSTREGKNMSDVTLNTIAESFKIHGIISSADVKYLIDELQKVRRTPVSEPGLYEQLAGDYTIADKVFEGLAEPVPIDSAVQHGDNVTGEDWTPPVPFGRQIDDLPAAPPVDPVEARLDALERFAAGLASVYPDLLVTWEDAFK